MRTDWISYETKSWSYTEALCPHPYIYIYIYMYIYILYIYI